MMKINSYDELINYLEENIGIGVKIILFDKNKKNIEEIGYVTINEDENDVFIDKEFFLKHEKRLQDFFLDVLKKKKDLAIIKIPNMLVTEELVDFVVNCQDLSSTLIHFYSLEMENIDDYLIEKLRKSNKYVVLNKNLISTFSGEEFDRLYEMNDVVFEVFKRTDEDFSLLKYTGNHAKIYLVPPFEHDSRINDNFINNSFVSVYEYDEKKYIDKILEILKELNKHGRKYNIVINVNNRELLKQSGILENDNFNIFIEDNTIEYTKEEYERQERELEEFVKPIKVSCLSPFEKYVAVYNIVKHFKDYKENYQNPDESRDLKYVLYNEYMTCYGFSKLLKVLLEKVGISSFVTSANIDDSYADGFTLEEKPTDSKYHGHARNVVKIDDDIYDIHGIFIADSTWDNYFKADLYSHVAMTFDRMKEAIKLEELKLIDLLIDFHSKEEFIEKFNYLVKVMERPVDSGESLKKEVVFYQIYLKICEILRKLDYSKYVQTFKKYESDLELLEQGLNDNNQLVFKKFLNEYVEYILPLVNKPIDKIKIMRAGLVVKKFVDRYDDKKLEEWYLATKKVLDIIDKVKFPYIYDPENSRNNYLELKDVDAKKR